MGEAKRRANAMAAARPWRMHLTCPSCKGARIALFQGQTSLSQINVTYAACADCRTLWEAYPADWHEDPVMAPACDNCAFRAGAPEHADRAAWRELLAQLRQGGLFNCHKGCPIIIDAAAMTMEFDPEWITKHGRTCAGFLRVMQAWPDWLANRYPGVAVEREPREQA